MVWNCFYSFKSSLGYKYHLHPLFPCFLITPTFDNSTVYWNMIYSHAIQCTSDVSVCAAFFFLPIRYMCFFRAFPQFWIIHSIWLNKRRILSTWFLFSTFLLKRKLIFCPWKSYLLYYSIHPTVIFLYPEIAFNIGYF